MDLAFVQEARILDERERRFAHELTYGTNRLRGRLDHLLGLRLHRGFDELDPELLDILRLGAYQILHMEVPDYAAVSQAVDLAPSQGAGLVNAVLRAIGRRGEDPDDFPRPESDLAAWLETWGSHPRWLVDRWLSRYPSDDVKELVRLNNMRPPLTLLPLTGPPEDAVGILAEEGIVAEVVGRGTRCVELAPGTDVARSLEVAAGDRAGPWRLLGGRLRRSAERRVGRRFVRCSWRQIPWPRRARVPGTGCRSFRAPSEVLA